MTPTTVGRCSTLLMSPSPSDSSASTTTSTPDNDKKGGVHHEQPAQHATQGGDHRRSRGPRDRHNGTASPHLVTTRLFRPGPWSPRVPLGDHARTGETAALDLVRHTDCIDQLVMTTRPEPDAGATLQVRRVGRVEQNTGEHQRPEAPRPRKPARTSRPSCAATGTVLCSVEFVAIPHPQQSSRPINEPTVPALSNVL